MKDKSKQFFYILIKAMLYFLLLLIFLWFEDFLIGYFTFLFLLKKLY